jgi:hypothetical protein
VTLGEILVTILDVQENFLLIGFARAFVIRIKAYITVLGPMTSVATLVTDVVCSRHDFVRRILTTPFVSDPSFYRVRAHVKFHAPSTDQNDATRSVVMASFHDATQKCPPNEASPTTKIP